jgi:hypothetical protein
VFGVTRELKNTKKVHAEKNVDILEIILIVLFLLSRQTFVRDENNAKTLFPICLKYA